MATAQTFHKFFWLVGAKGLGRSFATWLASLQDKITGVVATDGKTMDGSRDGSSAGRALHLVHAYTCETGLIIG